MNTCVKVQEDLERLRTGELLPEAESMVRAHLQECSSCAKEAILLEAFGERISKGLKEWVDAGTVPPMLAMQIEASIKAEARTKRGRLSQWARWRTPLGVAAAAVLLVAVAASMNGDWGQQLAAAGGVGGLFQTFLGRPLEHSKLEVEPVDPPVRTVTVNKLAQGLGITVHVDRVEFGVDQTMVAYRISGDGFRLGDAPNLSLLEPALLNAGSQVSFWNLTLQEQNSAYLFQAYFGPVSADGPLTFRFDHLPQSGQGGPRWVLGTSLPDQTSAGFGGEVAVLSGWTRADGRATATVEWDADHMTRLTGWSATDAQGRSYPVHDAGAQVVDGRRVQTLSIDAPAAVELILEATGHDRLNQGPWEIAIGSK